MANYCKGELIALVAVCTWFLLQAGIVQKSETIVLLATSLKFISFQRNLRNEGNAWNLNLTA